MTAKLYQEWLQQWDHKLGTTRRKIILLQDNFSGHIIPDGLQNIHVVNFKPNLTAHVQPMDQGIIRCFKAHYHAKYIQWAIDRYDADVTPSEIYEINQLQAMQLANHAWHEVDTMTIRHCWRKADILPPMDSSAIAQPTVPISSLLHTFSHDQDPIIATENELRCALDDLENTGVLQSKNWMDIKALINPPDESRMTKDTTDEEICQAVLAAHEKQTANGGDDTIEDDASPEPHPTYCEVFRAASVINRYVEHIDNLVARKLEATLASFGHQIRLERSQTLTTTQITDYFHHT